jgi:hypothetical protein
LRWLSVKSEDGFNASFHAWASDTLKAKMSRKGYGSIAGVALVVVGGWLLLKKPKTIEPPSVEQEPETVEVVSKPSEKPQNALQPPPSQPIKPVPSPTGKQILEGICTMDCCPETRSDKVLEETPLRAGPDMALPVLSMIRTDDLVRSIKSYYVIDAVGVGKVTQVSKDPRYSAIRPGDRLNLIGFLHDTVEKFWHSGREYTATNGVGILWEIQEPPQNPQDWLYVRADSDLEGWVLRGLAGLDWNYESCR